MSYKFSPLFLAGFDLIMNIAKTPSLFKSDADFYSFGLEIHLTKPSVCVIHAQTALLEIPYLQADRMLYQTGYLLHCLAALRSIEHLIQLKQLVI